MWIPITLREEQWGRLHLIEAGRVIDEVDALAVDRAAAAVSLSLLSEPDASLAEQAGSALVFDILQGRHASSKEILRRARALGADLEGRALACLAIVLQGFPAPAADRGVWERDRRRLRGEVLRGIRAVVAGAGCTGLAALDGARVLVIIGVPDGKPPRDVLAGIGREAIRRVEERLGLGAVVGATDGVSPDSLRRGLEDALEAAAFGVRAGGGPRFFEDLGVDHLLTRLSEGPELARFVESALKPLLDHDARTSSPLVPTLRAYLDSGGSKSETARRLRIDRRTLYHRLEHIERMLGRDLDDSDGNLELAIALRGRDLLKSRSGSARG